MSNLLLGYVVASLGASTLVFAVGVIRSRRATLEPPRGGRSATAGEPASAGTRASRRAAA